MQELHSEQELKDVYPLIKQLRPNLGLDEFISKTKEAQVKAKYRLFLFKYDDKPAALCGVFPFYVLYHTNCLYITDFVVDSALRSKGLGLKFLNQIESWALKEGYKEIELSSSFFRTQAHKFYETKAGFDKTSFVFKKKLQSAE